MGIPGFINMSFPQVEDLTVLNEQPTGDGPNNWLENLTDLVKKGWRQCELKDGIIPALIIGLIICFLIFSFLPTFIKKGLTLLIIIVIAVVILSCKQGIIDSLKDIIEGAARSKGQKPED